MKDIRVGSVCIGEGQPLAFIAGPCVIESREGCRLVAEALRRLADEYALPLVFKSSYDKANRSSVDSFRGPGIAAGLGLLSEIRDDFGLPLLTDVHSPEEATVAGGIVDMLQIPAFLCRQTDLLLAAGETGKPVNIKKGQVVAPADMIHAVSKVRSTGNDQVLLTERGAAFGYGNLVVDMRSLKLMREVCDCPVVFDATHSVQLPGGAGSASGGQPEFVQPLARAAVAFGVDAVFLEVHNDPASALCDGTNMLALAELPKLLEDCLAIRRALDETRAAGGAR